MIKLNDNSRSIAEGIIIAILSLCFLALFLWLLYTIRLVFLYIILAAILALMGRPLMYLFHGKFKLSSTLSAVMTIVIFIMVLSVSFYFLVPLLLQQADTISSMNITEIQDVVLNQLSVLNEFLLRYRITVLDEFLNTDLDKNLDFSKVTDWFANIFNILINFSVGTFSVLFITFFFLKERNLFNSMLLSPVPDKFTTQVAVVISQIKNLLSRYFIGITLQVFIMFTLYYLILITVGGVQADQSLIIALLCALCNIVPYLGPLVGFFIFVLLSLSNLYYQGMVFNDEIIPKLYLIAFGYMIAQLVDNFLNQPMIYSRSVKSHPLEIFLIIIIGGLVAGVGGIVLAVPIYTIIRVILKEFFSEFKFVQRLTKNI